MSDRWQIELLSPVAVGDGRQLRRDIDFLEDGADTAVVDAERLLAIAEDSEEALEALSASKPRVAQAMVLGRVTPRAIAAYVLRGRCSAAQIRAHSRSGGAPVIPGSSLRGALRTIALWQRMHRLDGTGKQWELVPELRAPVETAIRSGRERGPRPGVADALETAALGGESDLGAALAQLRCGEPSFRNGDLTLCESRLLSLRGRRLELKYRPAGGPKGRGGRGGPGGRGRREEKRRPEAPERGVDFMEALRPEARSTLRLSDGGSGLLEKLMAASFSLAVKETAREYRFFDAGGVAPLADWYARLNQRIVGEGGRGVIYLRLGWGCGWESVTGFNTDAYLRGRLRQAWGLGRAQVEAFPKTRHLVYEAGLARLPWGWLRLQPAG